MTSFVADVLITAGQLEKVDLNEKITEIQKKIGKLKNDVKDFIEDNYINFVPTLKKDQALAVKADEMIEEMKILGRRVQDQIKLELSGSTRKLKNLSDALKVSDASLRLSSHLLELCDSLKSVETNKMQEKYVEAAKMLRRAYDILETENDDLKLLNIYGPIKAEYCNCYANFLNDATALWKKSIFWQSSKSESGKEITSLTIEQEPEDIRELAISLRYVDGLETPIASFASDILKNCVVPIVRYDKTTIRVVDENTFIVEHGDENKKPTYQSVLYYLKLLFQFLIQHLDFDIENYEHFITRLSKHLLLPFSKILIDECIADTIPNSSAELRNFDEIIKEINEFQDYLLNIGFIERDRLFLSEYTKNVDNLFVEKMCQGLLARASAISRKDLHDSTKYVPEEPLQFLEEKLDDLDNKIDRRLSKRTFQLPACQISKSAKDILNLTREILEEACSNSEACAVRLFYTSRNVVEIYANTVPEYHKKFLETIPQQVALFHNNCMYLAHHLLSLAYEYKDRLPHHLQKHNITYTDLTLVLRNIGSEYFLNHMKYQRNIIFGILRESGLSQLGQTSELPSSTEKALRQCMRQLELLKTVWMDVLPLNIYCRAIGCITNSMVDEIVIKVITVEDITANVATELVTLFDMIVKRTPSIFPEPNTIVRYVPKWSKITELIKVLEASLKDIEDRWANGKGPLANEFTPNQVKQLIRALFQNTERRANLLTMIK